ncbi:MAG: lipid A phosphoethanolamine transferase [Muribaculum sp.]|nr:lipid A phosphoethanolamine transferase [Muribaculum sp.]
MKLFKLKGRWPEVLFIVVLVVSIVPNVILWHTENMPTLYGLVNVILPLGVYGMFMSLSSHVGRSTLWMIIVMFLAAFEIVLLDLYGNSVIGVDMWLNVVTSNSKEISELLGNLLPVIALVCLMYLPPIVAGVVAVTKKWRLSSPFLNVGRRLFACMSGTGLALLVIGIAVDGYVAPRYYLFPVNAVDNACIAVDRYVKTSHYADSSKDFVYGAESIHDSTAKEAYLLVIGETSRASNWEILGYERPTNPALRVKDGIEAFKKTLSESNTTHKSVPLMLSPLTAEQFGDSIYHVKSLITAFNEAGFRTVYLSNQERNGSFIDFFGEEADKTVFIKDDRSDHHLQDEALLDYLDQELAAPYTKMLIVMHTYGSHFNYRERYPADFSTFMPDDATEARRDNRERLINAYDNSILYTSDMLARVMSRLQQDSITSAVLYTSDHGEDIYDDARGLFLHASPRPSARQLHVPYLVWTSDSYAGLYPSVISALKKNADKRVSSSESFFHTALDLAGINCEKFDPTCSVANAEYREPEQWIYLNDHNEAVVLDESGLDEPDFAYLRSHDI